MSMRLSMPIFKYLGLFFALIFFLGCDNREEKKLYGEPTDMTINEQTEINYLNVHYFSLRTCVRCHQDRLSPDLSTFASLKTSISSVQREVNNGEMPPSEDGYDELTACQKLVLTTWVNAGMPKTGGPTLGASPNACY